MALSTFDELRESIADWLSRGDLTSQIPDFIHLAETRFFNDLNLRPLADEKKATGTITAGSQSLDWPADCGEVRFLRIESSPPTQVKIVSLNKLSDARFYNQSGLPDAAAIVGRTIEFDTAPGDDEDYTIWYWPMTTTRLSAGAPTNEMLSRRPDLYLYGALLASAPYLGADQRVGTWQREYDRAVFSEKRLQGRRRMGGGRLQIRPDHVDRV
jgi:hypothetical protein